MDKAYKGIWITWGSTALITIIFGYRIYGVGLVIMTLIYLSLLILKINLYTAIKKV